jgi:uracil-DNA glycosylase
MQQLAEAPAIRLEASWKERLWQEFTLPYMQNLRTFLVEQKKAGKIVYPAGPQIFQALDATPFDAVRVVVLGQDPYHGPGQAHGLCFSVPDSVAKPPSLINIFKELHADTGIASPVSGCLLPWARQGVLLLNSVLTVERDRAASHQGKGWEVFTDRIITLLNDQRRHVVFILWGSYAQTKGRFIDRDRHLVLESAHPSPLSAHRGFFGSKPFSRANVYLSDHGLPVIDWKIP